MKYTETLYIGENTVRFCAFLVDEGMVIDCDLTPDSPGDMRDLMEHGVIQLAIERARKALGVES